MTEKLYLYETHMHTSEGSRCARIGGAAAADYYKSLGYTGIFITDHFFNGNSTAPWDLPWERRVDILLSGYEQAKARGDEIGLDVYFGWEYCHAGSEILTYNLDREWLLSHPDVLSWSVNEYCAKTQADGAFLSQAHPFFEAPWIPYLRLFPRQTPACETFNAKMREETLMLDMAELYADKYKLHATAGSDFHFIGGVTVAAMGFRHKLKQSRDYGDCVMAGEGIIIKDAETYLRTE